MPAPKRRKTIPYFPNIRVEDFGRDGNAFALMGQVLSAMRRAGVSDEDRQAFQKEATAGDYDNVVQTCMKWVNV